MSHSGSMIRMSNLCRGLRASAPRHQVYESILDTIGRTPVVKVNKVLSQKALDNDVSLYAKLEYFNPLGSVKDRLAIAIIDAAEKSGALKPGQTVVEATSGNTGIGLAMVCAKKGYPFVAVMADSYSIDRRKIMRALGAKVIHTPAAESGTGMLAKAKELAKAHGWFWAHQFENAANAPYHANTTGPEIIRDFAGRRLDYWVTGYGTGGTFTGAGSILKFARPDMKIVLVEPDNAALVKSGHQQERNPDGSPSAGHPAFTPHMIQGWTPNFIPQVAEKGLQANIYDELRLIDGAMSIEMAKTLAKTEGIFTGISGGAAAAVGCKIAEDAPKGSVILVMLPDTQERYQNSALFADINEDMNEEELKISNSTK